MVPSEKTLVSGGIDRKVRLWDLASRKILTTEAQTDHLRAVAFSAKGDLLATGGFDSSVHLRQPRTGKEIAVYSEAGGGWAGVYALAFSPKADVFASALSNRQVHVRDRQGKLLFDLSGHTEAVRSVAFSPDGKLLVSASHQEAIVWEMPAGKFLQRLKAAAPVAFDPSTGLLASGGAGPALWDAAAGRLHAKLQGHRGEVYALAFAPSKRVLALGSWLGVTLVDLGQ
jgi:WD40 repeat protein